MPKGKKHTPEQIVRLLRDAEAGLAAGRTVGQICQEIGVSEQTYYRWKSLYGGMKTNELRRLKELEAGEPAPEEAGGRPLPGQRHAQGAGRGKLLSPARRRTAVNHLQRHLHRLRAPGGPRRRGEPLAPCATRSASPPTSPGSSRAWRPSSRSTPATATAASGLSCVGRASGSTASASTGSGGREGYRVPQTQHKRRRLGIPLCRRPDYADIGPKGLVGGGARPDEIGIISVNRPGLSQVGRSSVSSPTIGPQDAEDVVLLFSHSAPDPGPLQFAGYSPTLGNRHSCNGDQVGQHEPKGDRNLRD